VNFPIQLHNCSLLLVLWELLMTCWIKLPNTSKIAYLKTYWRGSGIFTTLIRPWRLVGERATIHLCMKILSGVVKKKPAAIHYYPHSHVCCLRNNKTDFCESTEQRRRNCYHIWIMFCDLISMNNIVEDLMGMSQDGSTRPKGDVVERPLRHLHCILMLRYSDFWKSPIAFARKLYRWYKNDYG